MVARCAWQGSSPRASAADRQWRTFVTLEDESGQVNVVVWSRLGARRNDVLVCGRA